MSLLVEAYAFGFAICVVVALGIQIFVNPSKINRRLDGLERKFSELENRLDGLEWELSELENRLKRRRSGP